MSTLHVHNVCMYMWERDVSINKGRQGFTPYAYIQSCMHLSAHIVLLYIFTSS